VAAVAAGCGGGSDGEASIRFLVFGDPAEIDAFREVIDAYEEREPDTRIQLVEASDRSDLLARLSTSFAGGSPPDVFLVNYRFYGQFAARGVLEPVEDRVAESEMFEEEDFYPQALDAFRWNGELTCLPQNISSLVVYYNRDLFRRYQAPEPRAGWTWAELVRTALQLTRDAQGLPAAGPEAAETGRAPAVYGVGVEPSIIRLAPFVWSNGGRVVDDEERPTRLTLDEPEALNAMQQLFDLRTVHGVTPTEEEVEAEDDESRFANGRLAMVLSSRRATPTFRTITAFDWDVAPLPRLAEPAGILHSDAYCLAREGEHVDETWRFVEFALGPAGQEIVARTGRTVPSLVSVSRSEAFLDPDAKPRHSEVFLDGIPAIRRVPTISTWPEIEDATAPILENGMYLGEPAYEVAEKLDRATRPIFARAER
jgi:multiple sugar transport system substrate-binding protein